MDSQNSDNPLQDLVRNFCVENFCSFDYILCLMLIFINNLLQHFLYLNELSFLIFLKLFFSF